MVRGVLRVGLGGCHGEGGGGEYQGGGGGGGAVDYAERGRI